jgi:DNA polymerase-3 subunit delta
MAREAAQALVEAVGTDLRELATALDQLMSSVDGPIEVVDVQRLFRGLETELWNFIDAVFDRDRSGAHARLQTLLARGENAIGITTALANQLRIIALVRGERRPAPALARELGVKEGKLRRALRQAKNFGPEDIRRAFRLLADADVALKGGERGEDEPAEIVLELLVAEIVGDARPATRPS